MKFLKWILQLFKKPSAPPTPPVSKYVCTLHPQPGQYIFKYNVARKELTCLGKRDLTVSETDGIPDLEKGSLYVVAVNKHNAAKKFLKILTRK